MPEIGKPDFSQNNPYKNIDIYRGTNNATTTQAEKDPGEILNKIAGSKEKSAFVDRNTHNKMGKDEFLRLLTHQLQNQDPMNPTDQTKFTAELAQFAQLEQLTNMNTKMESLKGNALAEAKFYAASFLGKEIVTNGTSLDLKEEGAESNIPFTLGKDAERVSIKVMDNKGNISAILELENIPAGNQTIKWDGKGLDKYPVPKGEYRVAIQAWDKNYEKVDVQTKTAGVITGVSFENGEAVFDVNNRKVYLRDVDSFKAPIDKKVNNNFDATKAYQKMLEDTKAQLGAEG